ncbi:concanavalin A-like lectin/glucanase domain-containing protein [Mariannaea sp. PMI_226]|nr:concanavalin A-like lectin/glucanase domain-containing protein [Mariannaea sp. PMI_226]
MATAITAPLLLLLLLLLPPRAAPHPALGTTVCGKKRYGEVTDSLMYNANAWNKKSPGNGFVCLDVYNSTPAFDAVWNWGEDIQDVHSFPYVRFGHANLPMRLSSIRSIQLSTEWLMTAGVPSEPPRTFSSSAMSNNEANLQKIHAQANAAWDFFLDSDSNRTLYPQVAEIELMVWLGSVGDPWWLGRENNTILSNLTIGEIEFSLYYGRNSGGTHVFTAVTSNGENVLSLDEDFYPIFEYLLHEAKNHPETPSDLPEDPFLGIVEFGTETWFSDGNVTFSAANFGMKLDGGEEDKGNSTSPDKGKGNSTSTGGGDDDNDDDNSAMIRGFPLIGYILPVFLVFWALA